MSKKSASAVLEVPAVDSKLQPYIALNDNVVVKRIDESVSEVGGILIPESAKKKSNKGVVLSAGPGRIVDGHLLPVGVVEGDVVLFTRYGGTESELDGDLILILREAEIYLKLRR